jgi:alkylation response protein AidB-like acyl-CoA dehydrogenase
LQIALNVLNIGRFKLGAADLGGCKAALGHTVAYALERRTAWPKATRLPRPRSSCSPARAGGWRCTRRSTAS